jgi:hypothetical protein
LVRPDGRFGGDVHTVWWCSDEAEVEAEAQLRGEPDGSALISLLIGHILFLIGGRAVA